jgi:sugar phosphate permease
MLTGLGTVLYVGSTDLRLIAAGGLIWGVFIGGLEPLLRTLLHLASPHEYVGRIVGTAQWHKSAGELIPLAFVPALAATLGIQRTLIAGGLLVTLAGFIGLRTARSIDREHLVPEAAPTPVPEVV